MKDLTVVVLTHKRVNTVLETIQSVLQQTCHDFYFIVSDNSGDTATRDLLEKNGIINRLEYVNRGVELSSQEHFNIVISEIKTDYFILFHDDDVMMPKMVETLYKSIVGTKYIAVGCNACILRNHVYSRKKVLRTKNNIVIDVQKKLIPYYCNENAVPFPSYIYSRIGIDSTVFGTEAGKYSDVIWFIDILKGGSFLWLSEPLFYYRIHDNQDSNTFDYYNQRRLVKYYERIAAHDQYIHKIVYRYRIYLMYINEILRIRKGKRTSRFVFLFLLHKREFSCFINLLLRNYLLHHFYVRKYS